MHPDLSTVGRALAAPARAAMLHHLLDGQEHAARRLADVAGVRQSTASEHLAVLVASGLVSVSRQGRLHRYRIADAPTAAALEALSRPAQTEVTSLRLSREQRRIRLARTCYDHLAGQLGVAIHDAAIAQNWVDGEHLAITSRGARAFHALGIDEAALAAGRRPVIRSCPDWTERRSHLAGGLGAAIAGVALERDWVRRVRDSRGLTITAVGRRDLPANLGLPPADWLDPGR